MKTVMMAMMPIPKLLWLGQSLLMVAAAYLPTPCFTGDDENFTPLVGATVVLMFPDDVDISTGIMHVQLYYL